MSERRQSKFLTPFLNKTYSRNIAPQVFDLSNLQTEMHWINWSCRALEKGTNGEELGQAKRKVTTMSKLRNLAVARLGLWVWISVREAHTQLMGRTKRIRSNVNPLSLVAPNGSPTFILVRYKI